LPERTAVNELDFHPNPLYGGYTEWKTISIPYISDNNTHCAGSVSGLDHCGSEPENRSIPLTHERSDCREDAVRFTAATAEGR
jgi:hypothetical protein